MTLNGQSAKFAKIYDLPREHLIKNLDLLDIANKSKNVSSIKKLPAEFAKKINDEINKIDPQNIIDFPYKLSSLQKNHIDKIKSVVAKISKKYQLNEQFLLNNNQIKNIVINNNIFNIDDTLSMLL